MADAEKKIIIDEDWKSQVAAEKEALEKQREQAATTESGATKQAPEAPPASLEMLVSVLATEAMVALGQLPRPGQQQPEVDANQAKFFIDLLGVLQEKTKGNLTPQESAGLEQLLHELRMTYVAVSRQHSAVTDKL